MEEDKLLNELEKLRNQISGLKRALRRRQNENNLMSLVLFLFPLGVAIILYSADILNQALDFHAPIWYGYVGIATGIFIALLPALIVNEMPKRKKGVKKKD